MKNSNERKYSADDQDVHVNYKLILLNTMKLLHCFEKKAEEGKVTVFDIGLMDVLLGQISKVIRSENENYLDSYLHFTAFVDGFEHYAEDLSPFVPQIEIQRAFDRFTS